MISDVMVDHSPPRVDWKQAHAELVRVAGSQAALDAEQARWLLAALRSAAHIHLGYGTFGEYLERLFGYGPRLASERLRVAEALEELPAIARALEAGAVTWSAVRELTRVATRETEEEWLAAACGKTARQIEQLVSGYRPGDAPGDPGHREAQRHVLRIELSAESMASYREAVARLRRDSGGHLDEDAAILAMARIVLGGPADPGRASYQIALTVCPQCERGWQHGRGELLEVGADTVAMAQCDSQCIGAVGADTHVGGRHRQGGFAPPTPPPGLGSASSAPRSKRFSGAVPRSGPR